MCGNAVVFEAFPGFFHRGVMSDLVETSMFITIRTLLVLGENIRNSTSEMQWLQKFLLLPTASRS